MRHGNIAGISQRSWSGWTLPNVAQYPAAGVVGTEQSIPSVSIAIGGNNTAVNHQHLNFVSAMGIIMNCKLTP